MSSHYDPLTAEQKTNVDLFQAKIKDLDDWMLANVGDLVCLGEAQQRLKQVHEAGQTGIIRGAAPAE